MLRNNMLLIGVLLGITACSSQQGRDVNSDRYEIREDSLFLGYSFGMTLKEFFDHSWDINSKGIVSNGSGAEIVHYTEIDGEKVKQTFYPVFVDSIITEMPVIYSYSGWAPWNRHLFSDSLKTNLTDHLSGIYDIEFDTLTPTDVENPSMINTTYNREIRISELDKSRVLVHFSDLSKIDRNK